MELSERLDDRLEQRLDEGYRLILSECYKRLGERLDELKVG